MTTVTRITTTQEAKSLKFNAVALAELLGLSSRRIYQLVEEEVLTKKDASFDVIESVQNYNQYIQSLQPEYSDYEEALKIEQIRLTKARADKAEVESQLATNSVVLIEDVEKEFADVVVEVRTWLLNIPGRATLRVMGESSEKRIKAILLDEIKEALTSLAELSKLAQEEDN